MIELWYMDIETVSQQEFSQMLTLLPDEMQQDVRRYRFHEDQCRKLLGRMMVGAYLKQRSAFSWTDFQLSSLGKPFVEGCQPFSISHSGAMVVAAFGTEAIGVDVEEQKLVEVGKLLHHLHPNESRFVANQGNQQEAFHKVWTRKEAFFKAMGTGLLHGTDHVDCQPDQVHHDQSWNISTLDWKAGYSLSVCSAAPLHTVTLQEQFAAELITSLKTNQ